MTSIIRFPAPNIVPGLNLTAATFAEIYNWINAVSADSVLAVRQPFQYGLIAGMDGKQSLILEKNGTKIALIQCLAITSAGSIVGHFEQLHAPLTVDLALENLYPQEQYALFIEVKRSVLSAFGDESSDLPLRPLHTKQACQLHIQPYNQTLHAVSDAVCIGLLQQQSGEWQLLDYIPPCIHIGADARLRVAQRGFIEAIIEFSKLFPKVILNTDSHQTKSMLELRELTFQLGSFMSYHSHRYFHLGERGNPFDLFELWIGMARQMSFLLKCLKDSQGFYRLLKQNTSQLNGVFFTPETWNNSIQQLANFQYRQEDILTAIKASEHFINTITPVFKSLAFDDYESDKEPIIEDKETKFYTNW